MRQLCLSLIFISGGNGGDDSEEIQPSMANMHKTLHKSSSTIIEGSSRGSPRLRPLPLPRWQLDDDTGSHSTTRPSSAPDKRNAISSFVATSPILPQEQESRLVNFLYEKIKF